MPFEWPPMKLEHRGDADVFLADMINNSFDEVKFAEFIAYGEENGAWDANDYPNKTSFIAGLGTLEEALKNQLVNNRRADRDPFF